MGDNQVGQEEQARKQQFVADDVYDLRELFGILWADKWMIVVLTAFSAVISLSASLMMTDVYRAEATLVPADTDQSQRGGLTTQFGGAAALLGVNINPGGGDEVSNAIATLKSRRFIGRFIDENELLVPLFASSWDKSTRQNFIHDEVYNSATGEWLDLRSPPTDQDAYRKFSELLNVDGPDRESGLVVLSIDWHNPIEAASWVNGLISALNQEIKYRDVSEANGAIDYLRRQLESTQLVEMQRVFYQLIESQTRITMLADVRDEYVFRVIDPAVVPETSILPRRLLICVVGMLVGFGVAILLVIVRRVRQ
jgi:uncharacterized protein involved in exopolysaccharide biosynthesis